MTLEDFRQTLLLPKPPAGLSEALLALWWDGKADWERAHQAVADANSSESAWVHGYLHRAEGDLGNAAYWYRRAGKPAAEGALPAEWDTIAASLLAP